MAVARTEGSLLTSLSELRTIEHQRLAEERAAIEAAAQAKRQQREAAERTARDAASARLAAERDAQVAAERARADSEREARMRIEAADAAERARHLIALEQHRLAEESALRREVARRQRPRWMLAVTAAALIAAVALGWFALESQRTVAAAQQARDRAERDQATADDDARRANAELDNMVRGLAELDAKVSAAIERVKVAQTDADRRVARDNLRRLQQQQQQLNEQKRLREQARRRGERLRPVVVNPECLRNALCK